MTCQRVCKGAPTPCAAAPTAPGWRCKKIPACQGITSSKWENKKSQEKRKMKQQIEIQDDIRLSGNNFCCLDGRRRKEELATKSFGDDSSAKVKLGLTVPEAVSYKNAVARSYQMVMVMVMVTYKNAFGRCS